ncbi:MAG: hypothetical protein Q8N83_07230 [Ignavibacteria bacterium]|nr:hypothetical protein [Ignavibacteria bacterium]
MNKIFSFFILLLLFTAISCKEETVVMSLIKDGEESKEGVIPFRLEQNFPNPFNPSTSIGFGLGKETRLKMNVFTEDWELVDVLLDETKTPGTYVIEFEGLNDKGKALPSGNYYYTLEGDGLILTRQMTLLK